MLRLWTKFCCRCHHCITDVDCTVSALCSSLRWPVMCQTLHTHLFSIALSCCRWWVVCYWSSLLFTRWRWCYISSVHRRIRTTSGLLWASLCRHVFLYFILTLLSHWMSWMKAPLPVQFTVSSSWQPSNVHSLSSSAHSEASTGAVDCNDSWDIRSDMSSSLCGLWKSYLNMSAL